MYVMTFCKGLVYYFSCRESQLLELFLFQMYQLGRLGMGI